MTTTVRAIASGWSSVITAGEINSGKVNAIAMGKTAPSKLTSFTNFSAAIRHSLLIGERALPITRKIYALAQQKVYQDLQKEVAQEDAKSLRPAVDLYDRAIKATRNARKYVDKIHTIFGPVSTPVEVEDIGRRLNAIEDTFLARKQTAASGIHRKLRRPKDEPSRWKSLIGQEYEMEHFRVRATDHWFFRELDALLTRHKMKQEIRHEIIRDVMQAAFNEYWQTEAIKAAIYRGALKKRPNNSHSSCRISPF